MPQLDCPERVALQYTLAGWRSPQPNDTALRSCAVADHRPVTCGVRRAACCGRFSGAQLRWPHRMEVYVPHATVSLKTAAILLSGRVVMPSLETILMSG